MIPLVRGPPPQRQGRGGLVGGYQPNHLIQSPPPLQQPFNSNAVWLTMVEPVDFDGFCDSRTSSAVP